MPTSFLHRLIVVCPASRFAALNTFWRAQIDSADDVTTWPGLNATGLPADPVTHRWCSTALTETLLRPIIVQVCGLASVTPPTVGTWNGWTRAEKRGWLAGVRASFLASTGIWLALSDNDGAWDDPAVVLAAMGSGLKVIAG